MSIGNEECYYAIYNGDTLNLFCDLTTVPQMNFMNIDFRDVNSRPLKRLLSTVIQ